MLNLSCHFLQKSFNNAMKTTYPKFMNKYLLLFLTSLAIAGIAIILKGRMAPPTVAELDKQKARHQFVIVQAHTLLGFNLTDPDQAPPDIRESIARGYRIIMNTPFYAPNYARDQLSCTNCHFAEGDTLGGKNNGLSLVGVTTHFPRYSKRAGRVITLADRVNYCFERSLNGKSLPLNSQEMLDIINYLKWISHEVETIQTIPWLGISYLKSQHQPVPENGAIVYQVSCASCHKANGEGGGVLPGLGKTIPPLWGFNSFNDGAGMSRLPMLAAFIYWNMPYQEAFLTEEEAIDVAAFILQQPRAHFIQESS